KPGIKPSDLKKQAKLSPNPTLEKNIIPTYSNHGIPTPPPTPPLKPKKDTTIIPELEATNRDESPNQNQAKSPVKSELTPQPQPQLYLFTCDICEQNKKSQLHLHRVNGLGIDPHKTQKICSSCLKK
ncbi:33416_t:CDS:1, partial [Racocetra persica]